MSDLSAPRTFLIADVRGYTSFTEEYGDEAAAELVTSFLDLTERTVVAGGGSVLECRGDEVLATFASPRAAIRCAVRLQQVLRSEQSPPLPVGIGLDVGEAVVFRDGYRGGALNLAARLCGLAGPGEVLATREVIHLAGTTDRITVEDRGEVRLKNLRDPVRVVALSSADDRAGPAATGSDAGPLTRVAVADDSALFREGVARVLSDNGFVVAGRAADPVELLQLVARVRPDVVVSDIRMPPTHTDEGLVTARTIRSEHPETGVLILSQYVQTRHAVDLLRDSPGRVGYLLKDRVADIADFVDAVRRIARGGLSLDPEVVAQLLRHPTDTGPLDVLTEREREILGVMAEGRSNQAIGERLSLSPKTVETHVGSIFSKLGLLPGADDHRRVLAVLAYLREVG